MNKCPNCNQIYPNDDVFCLNDGTTLLPISDLGQAPTIAYSSVDIPTGVDSSPQTNTAPAADYKWLYMIIGAMGAALAVMAVFMFLPKTGVSTETAKTERAVSSPDNLGQTDTSESKTTPEKLISAPTQANPTPVNTAAPVYTPSRPASSPGGAWSGDWSSPSGAYFTLKVSLTDDGTGNVEGQIEWTMQRTRRPEKMNKIGMSAVEYVRGQFNPATQILTMKGYGKNDPNGVLVMTDNYRLTLAGNNSLNGAARNGGKWDGKLNLSRR